ncbi:RraA family protein [Microbacterium sp. cf332]|uniref:RraA family protein n=1 Tax=Microbacterium sp. cf332 TaxID=1761804 RepID=UPI000888DBC9|nr:methyltransferase [Microbacterium sp. cf332]SDQ54447.1 RraA famliy [Microbacterium sp. cf332]
MSGNDRPSAELLARFARIPSANIGDGMDRLGLMDAGISPIWAGATITGPAFTCWTRSGDNLWIHNAIDEAQAGDVIVVNGNGDLTRALIGELIAARAKAKGIAGFVIDGAVRDADGMREYGMPVFARALTPAGPYKHGPGRLGVPIAVGGVSVSPGDVIVADADGVAVIPLASAASVVSAAEAVQAREDDRRRELERHLTPAS